MTEREEKMITRVFVVAGLIILVFWAICCFFLIPLAHAQEVVTSDPALICSKVDSMSYSRQHRKLLLEDERRADFARFGIPWSDHGHYELDHWIPLCLGGADTPANRRPQRCWAWDGPRCVSGPAADKDATEQEACREACMPLVGGFGLDPSNIRAKTIADGQEMFKNWKDW